MATSWECFRRPARLWRAAPVLVLAMLLPNVAPVLAASLTIRPHLAQGVNLIAASVPVTPDWQLPGYWGLVRLFLSADTNFDNAVVILQSDQGPQWECTARLRAGAGNEVDIVAPGTLHSSVLQYTIRNGSQTFAAGELGPNRGEPRHYRGGGYDGYSLVSLAQPPDTGGDGYIPPPPHTQGIFVGELPASVKASWSKILAAFPAEDMRRLGMHAMCLNRTHLIVLPAAESLDFWRSLPGIHDWLVDGGILIVLGSSSTQWTPSGHGGILQQSGPLSSAQMHRLLLASTTEFSLLSGMAPARYQTYGHLEFWPGPKVFPGVQAPLWPLLGVLSLYLLLLIPLNFLALRRLGRKEASWITIPLLVLAFAVTVYGVCRGAKGGSTHTLRFSVVKEEAPGVYSGLAYTSIFAPRNSRYDITLPGPFLPTREGTPTDSAMYELSGIHPKQFIVDETSSRTIVRDYAVPQWYAETLKYAFEPAFHGVVSGTASFTSGAAGSRGTWEVTVSNHTKLKLEDCWVSAPGEVFSVGSFSPGDSRIVRQTPISAPDHSDVGTTVEERLRRAEGFRLGTRGVYLLGWCRAPLQDSQVSGCYDYQDQTLVIVPLTIVAGAAGLAMPDSSLGANILPWVLQEEAPVRGVLFAIHLPADLEAHPRSRLVVHTALAFPDARTLPAGDFTEMLDDSTESSYYGGYLTGKSGASVSSPVYAWDETLARWKAVGHVHKDYLIIPVGSLPRMSVFPTRRCNNETILYLHQPGWVWNSNGSNLQAYLSSDDERLPSARPSPPQRHPG